MPKKIERIHAVGPLTDLGVSIAGAPLICVKRKPRKGQYSVDAKAGVYTINPKDAGKLVKFTYLYMPHGRFVEAKDIAEK